MLEAYLEKLPRSIRLLNEIAWGELAEWYRNRTNDESYGLDDRLSV
jgi:hypothetical protein